MSGTATTSALTGLPDRSSCVAETVRLIEYARSTETSLAVLWLDLDRFLVINRSLGHRAGDQVIRKISARLHGYNPDEGLLCHVGADEFVLLAPGAGRETAAALADGLLRRVDAPLQLGTVALHPTGSIGIALLEPGETAATLLERADRAMLEAKQQGGNRWVFSGEERISGRQGILLAREELEIENGLHEALETGGLALHYQPILRRDGTVEAAEALMRCGQAPSAIPPDRLIPVAEKTGLIARLGEWSILSAAEFAGHLYGQRLATRIAVNVSRAQLLSDGFAESLSAALLVAGIDPGLLELELTESLFMDMSPLVQCNLERCIELGVSLAIDDFGTGFSCLANLKDLPASKLKLDRAFTMVLPGDRRAYAVVRAMTQLGRELGMTVVAEGVETADQAEALWEAGVDAVQGYYLARPMDADSLREWLDGAGR